MFARRYKKFLMKESDFMKKFIDQEKVVFMKDTLSLGWLTSFGYTQETAKKVLYINSILGI